MRCARPSKLKVLTTATAAGAWLAVCTYLYTWWPSLGVALDVHLPRTAFLVLGVATPIALCLKDRCMRTPTAVLVDALLAAPPMTAIAFLVYPFLVPVE